MQRRTAAVAVTGALIIGAALGWTFAGGWDREPGSDDVPPTTAPGTEPDPGPEPEGEGEPAPEPAPDVDPDVPIGLLATRGELEVWRQRAQEGPFATAGDHSPGSPGDWEEMLESAARIEADPEYGLWPGPDGDGEVTRDDTADLGWPDEHRRWSRDLYDAALVAIVDQDEELAADVHDAITAQARVDRADFADDDMWTFEFSDVGLNFPLAELLMDLLLAWDTVVTGMDLEEDDTVDEWFAAWAHGTADDYDANLEEVFPDRGEDDYSSRADWVDGDEDEHVAYTTSDGEVVEAPRIMRFYNNRRNNLAATVGLIGLYLEDEELVEDAKRYCREYVAFGFRAPDGVYGDSDRWRDDLPQLSFGYALSVGHLATFADALARTGDTSIYDLTTDVGSNGEGGTASDTSFRALIESFARHVRLGWDQYGTDDPAEAGDPDTLLGPLVADGEQFVSDARFLRAAAYYDDETLLDSFLRVHPDAPGWDAQPPRNGWSVDGRRTAFLTVMPGG